jgi:hypothetical protein
MLSTCPTELVALDNNAPTLWSKLLRRIKVTISQGEIIEDHRGWILRSFGLPDLLFRLECQQKREQGRQDERARARIWFHIAESCSAGESIPELTAENKYVLNPWIVTRELKHPNPRLEMLSGNSRPTEEPAKPKRKRPSAVAKEAVWGKKALSRAAGV